MQYEELLSKYSKEMRLSIERRDLIKKLQKETQINNIKI